MNNRQYTLNSKEVSSVMWHHAKDIKNQGGKAYFVEGPEQEQGCTNCNGHGYFHLQTVHGGPFSSVPPTISKLVKKRNGQGEEDIHIIASWDNDDGAWYQMKIQGYKCPICGGASQQPNEIVL